jgi:hypothetical protein
MMVKVLFRSLYDCERSEATILLGVEPGNKQIQIYGPSDFGRLAIYVLCPRHFFVNGSTTLAMCEIKCSVYFCPKKIGVSWLCTSNFGIEMYIFVQVSVSLICRPNPFLYVLDILISCTLQ